MNNLKDFVPPVVIRLLKQLIGLETTREYDNYADAIKKCSTFSYGNSEFCDMLADKTNAFNHEFKLKPYNLKQSDSCLLAAINLYMKCTFKKKSENS